MNGGRGDLAARRATRRAPKFGALGFGAARRATRRAPKFGALGFGALGFGAKPRPFQIPLDSLYNRANRKGCGFPQPPSVLGL